MLCGCTAAERFASPAENASQNTRVRSTNGDAPSRYKPPEPPHDGQRPPHSEHKCTSSHAVLLHRQRGSVAAIARPLASHRASGGSSSTVRPRFAVREQEVIRVIDPSAGRPSERASRTRGTRAHRCNHLCVGFCLLGNVYCGRFRRAHFIVSAVLSPLPQPGHPLLAAAGLRLHDFAPPTPPLGARGRRE